MLRTGQVHFVRSNQWDIRRCRHTCLDSLPDNERLTTADFRLSFCVTQHRCWQGSMWCGVRASGSCCYQSSVCFLLHFVLSVSGLSEFHVFRRTPRRLVTPRCIQDPLRLFRAALCVITAIPGECTRFKPGAINPSRAVLMTCSSYNTTNSNHVPQLFMRTATLKSGSNPKACSSSNKLRTHGPCQALRFTLYSSLADKLEYQ